MTLKKKNVDFQKFYEQNKPVTKPPVWLTKIYSLALLDFS